MVDAHTAIIRWADIQLGKTKEPPLKTKVLYTVGDKVFSYGAWFELARPLRAGGKRIRAFLLNGDQSPRTGWGNPTAQHQWQVRQALSTAEQPRVIIPYSALEAAGVDLDSIRVLDVLQDRTEERKHHSDTFPEDAKWHDEPIWGKVAKPADEVERLREVYPYMATVAEPNWITHDTVQTGSKRILRVHHSRSQWNTSDVTISVADDGTKSYDWVTHHHWLGESLIKARVTWRERVRCPDCEGLGKAPNLTGTGNCAACRGGGEVTKVHHRWTLFLSGFDHQEPAPLYFLCEMPYRCKALTVAEAYEALKPEPVKLAEQMGRKYTRQGDIFAVPTTYTPKILKQMGATIQRRRVAYRTRWGGTVPIRGTTLPYLLGTNHTATEVAYLPGGVTLARGMLYHDPSGRVQDHIRRKMGDGKTWHLIIKNTVPTS